MNIPRLLAIKAAILAEPHLYDQNYFEVPRECGTAGCFGGWALSLYKNEVTDEDRKTKGYSEIAAKILDLDRDQADNLFFESPEQYSAIWNDAGTPELARLAAERIDFFIKTNGTDQE